MFITRGDTTSSVMRSALALCALLAVPTAALAQGQALIPSPYPSGVTGAQPLDPEPSQIGGPQSIMRDPYPQTTGDFSQGNPPIARRMRHQRLVPSTFKRKYRVENHGGARSGRY